MELKEMAKQYHGKLVLEGVLKAIFAGVAVGCLVNCIYSLVAWFFGFASILVSLAVLLFVTALATTAFYFLKFRPTDEQVARRLDSLGLEERIITMNELKNDNSYVAQRQREDAKMALSQANSKLMKFVVSVPLAIVFGLSLTLSVCANALNVNTNKSGKQVFDELVGKTQAEYVIQYEVTEGGYIEGEMFQIVKHGENATPVMVVADEGYMFEKWSDESTSPYRELEIAVTAENLKPYMQADGTYLIVAKMRNIEYELGGGEEGNGNNQDVPNDPNAPPSNWIINGEGNGNGEGEGDGTSGGPNTSANQIIDGETYYGNENDYPGYQQGAQDRIEHDGNLGDDKKGSIGDYYDIITPGEQNNGEQ